MEKKLHNFETNMNNKSSKISVRKKLNISLPLKKHKINYISYFIHKFVCVNFLLNSFKKN